MRDIFKSFILSLDKNAVVSKSHTTDSIYYTISGLKIRYSNHFGSNDDLYDIFILQSLNANSYVLKIIQSKNILILPLKDVKSYIQSQIYYKQLIKSQHDALEKTKELRNYIKETTNDWSTFCNLLAKSSNYKRYSSSKKKVMKSYFEKGIQGTEFIRIFGKLKPSMTSVEIANIFETLI